MELTDNQLAFLSRASQRPDRCAEIAANLKGGAPTRPANTPLGRLNGSPTPSGTPSWGGLPRLETRSGPQGPANRAQAAAGAINGLAGTSAPGRLGIGLNGPLSGLFPGCAAHRQGCRSQLLFCPGPERFWRSGQFCRVTAWWVRGAGQVAQPTNEPSSRASGARPTRRSRSSKH
jgi:hypothetical protein